MKKLSILLILCMFIFTGCSYNDTLQFFKTSIFDETVTIDSVHQNSYEGKTFHFGTNFTMNSGDIVYFMGCTQDKSVHFREFLLNADANPIVIQFFEAPTITNNGSSLPLGHNRNRQSSNNSTLLLFNNPTVTNEGTQLFIKAIQGTQQKVSGETSAPVEWILDNNTCYNFKIHNQNGNGVSLYANFFWYEI